MVGATVGTAGLAWAAAVVGEVVAEETVDVSAAGLMSPRRHGEMVALVNCWWARISSSWYSAAIEASMLQVASEKVSCGDGGRLSAWRAARSSARMWGGLYRGAAEAREVEPDGGGYQPAGSCEWQRGAAGAQEVGPDGGGYQPAGSYDWQRGAAGAREVEMLWARPCEGREDLAVGAVAGRFEGERDEVFGRGGRYGIGFSCEGDC